MTLICITRKWIRKDWITLFSTLRISLVLALIIVKSKYIPAFSNLVPYLLTLWQRVVVILPPSDPLLPTETWASKHLRFAWETFKRRGSHIPNSGKENVQHIGTNILPTMFIHWNASDSKSISHSRREISSGSYEMDTRMELWIHLVRW